VLTRSLATSFSTLLPVLALLLFGGTTLKDFAFALLVGIASGTYSSIFIASPVLSAWKEREPDFRARRERIVAAMGTVPPFAEEAPVAKLDEEEEEPEPEEAPEALTPASQAAGRRSQAEILAEAGLSREKEEAGDGVPDVPDEVSEDQVVGASSDGETSTGPGQQDDKRRRQRGRRRKHGRRR